MNYQAVDLFLSVQTQVFLRFALEGGFDSIHGIGLTI